MCFLYWLMEYQFAMSLTLFVVLLCLMTISIDILFHQTLSLFRNVGIRTLLLRFDRPQSIFQ